MTIYIQGPTAPDETLEVGQSLILVDHLENESEVVLERVGRKFGHYAQWGRQVGFDLTTGRVNSNRGSASRVFTPRALALHRERQRTLLELNEAACHGWTNHLSTEQANAVLAILRGAGL